MLLTIDKGAHSARGGSGTREKIERTVHIPGIESYFRITSVSAGEVENEHEEVDRVGTVSATAQMRQSDLDKYLSVVLLPKDAVYGKSLSNMKEVESRGGRIIVITDAPSPELEDIAWEIIQVPTSNPCLLPLLLTIPLQLLAYHTAVHLGCDVDKPRNLAKSVTVE